MKKVAYYQAPASYGWLKLTLNEEEKVVAAVFVDRPGKSRAVPVAVARALDQYFKTGKDLPRKLFVWPTACTAFQSAVWQAISAVPSGKTITYTELSQAVGRPQAARAAGTACGRNPIALFIPCHRVVRSNGEDFGYSWGPERKRALLTLEGAI